MSPLKWHGGKHYLAAKIVALMPPHVHYVEPYFGGGAVLLAKPPGGSEVVNDIDGDLANFWRVLRCPEMGPRFVGALQFTPFSESEWEAAGELLSVPVGTLQADMERRAWAFFVRVRQSMAGRMKSFAPLSRSRTRRGINEQASAWLSAVEGLPAVAERLRPVVILNRPAVEVLRSQDGPDTLFYLDPPYYPDTRATPDVYAHEMSAADHRHLLEVVNGLRACVMLSGYRNGDYDKALVAWNRHDFDLPNNAASGSKKARKVESLWCNF